MAVLKSANMSLGINLLMKLVKEAAQTLAAAGFDMEIVEKHHRLKVDAPSGTALALADSRTRDWTTLIIILSTEVREENREMTKRLESLLSVAEPSSENMM